MNPSRHSESEVLGFCGPMLQNQVDRYHVEGLDRADLEQEASLALVLAVRSWPGSYPFLGYARNKVRQRLTQLVREAKRRKGKPPVGDEGRSPDPVEPIDPAPGPDLRAEMAEELARVQAILEPHEARVVELIYWDGATQREAALALGLPIRTLQSYQARALQKLRGASWTTE